jgi:regulator of nucleoside diphosphate kinase
MPNLSNLIVSTCDLKQLEALLDSLPAGPGKAQKGLLDELDRADIRLLADMPPDVVRMNSTVLFSMDVPPSQLCVTLVYPQDANGHDRISVLAPIGSALLGLAVGDTIAWPRPGGASSTSISSRYETHMRRGEHRRQHRHPACDRSHDQRAGLIRLTWPACCRSRLFLRQTELTFHALGGSSGSGRT